MPATMLKVALKISWKFETVNDRLWSMQ